MKPITPGQLKKINTIVGIRKIDKDTKSMMVGGFSAGRTNTSKELYFEEANLLIRHLEETDINYQAAEKMRRKLLFYAHEMGWQKLGVNGKLRVDMKRVDDWCKHYSYLKKKLGYYQYKELPKLLTQFEAVYKSYLQSLK